MRIELTFLRSREGTAALKAGTGTSSVTSPLCESLRTLKAGKHFIDVLHDYT
jgi:hypothetical protein